jgi:hypothetical protein
MINPDEQFSVLGGYFSDTCTQHIFDWDQRRWIGLKGNEGSIGKDEDAVKLLKTVYEKARPDAVEIRLSDQNTFASDSIDPEDDSSQFVHYPRYAAYESELDTKTVLKRSQLQEIDRLGRCVDLVEYADAWSSKKAVFKYQLIPHHLDKVWTEGNIVRVLQGHPSIVSLDKFVVDDDELRLVGFASEYVPGETLRDNCRRPFQLSWLQELTQVVDDLNPEAWYPSQGHCPL